jgi:Transglutaminase-like superfamily
MLRDYALVPMLTNVWRATRALAIARWNLPEVKPVDVLARNRLIAERLAHHGGAPDTANIPQLCDETSFFIRRMAKSVPWRSDCLVQALAGQDLLAQAGIATEIVVGTARKADGTFLSHAWLRQQERIILGGDVCEYDPLLEPIVQSEGLEVHTVARGNGEASV